MKRELTLRVDGKEIVVEVYREGERIVVEHENERHEILVTSDRPAGVVPAGGEPARPPRAPSAPPVRTPDKPGGGRTPTAAGSGDAPAPATEPGATPVTAPMVGVVREVHAEAGASVTEGEKLVTMEAMKMDIYVLAPVAGTLASVSCSVGQTVKEGQTVATITSGSGSPASSEGPG